MDANALRRQIPDSILPYPKGAYNRAKYVFWRIIYPFHNIGRDFLLFAGIIRHHGRQNFVLGTLAPGKTVEDLLSHLEKGGWGNHFIAWKDEGEIVSVRKLVDFERQYHLRVFADGEVRGHYEYTPESHPYWHMIDRWEARGDEFLQFLEGWVVPAAPVLAPVRVPAPAFAEN